MKLTKSQLKRIIQEELQNILQEQDIRTVSHPRHADVAVDAPRGAEVGLPGRIGPKGEDPMDPSRIGKAPKQTKGWRPGDVHREKWPLMFALIDELWDGTDIGRKITAINSSREEKLLWKKLGGQAAWNQFQMAVRKDLRDKLQRLYATGSPAPAPEGTSQGHVGWHNE